MKVFDIDLKYAKQGDELKDSPGGKLAKYRKMKEIGEANDEELKGVFTDAQYSDCLEKKQELKKVIKEHIKDNKS